MLILSVELSDLLRVQVLQEFCVVALEQGEETVRMVNSRYINRSITLILVVEI